MNEARATGAKGALDPVRRTLLPSAQRSITLSLPARYPHVFRPITVGSMTLKNRIQFSPIVSRHAETLTRAPRTNDLVEFLGAQARSGVGAGHHRLLAHRLRQSPRFLRLPLGRPRQRRRRSVGARRGGAPLRSEALHRTDPRRRRQRPGPARRSGLRALGHPRHPQPGAPPRRSTGPRWTRSSSTGSTACGGSRGPASTWP